MIRHTAMQTALSVACFCSAATAQDTDHFWFAVTDTIAVGTVQINTFTEREIRAALSAVCANGAIDFYDESDEAEGVKSFSATCDSGYLGKAGAGYTITRTETGSLKILPSL